MKLILLILLLPIIGLSQVEIRNLSLKTPESRILYRGGENFLRIENVDIDSTAILCNSIDTMLVYKRDSYYIFYYAARTKKKADTLRLIYKNEMIDTFIYEVRNLNDYKIYLGSLKDTLVTLKQLLGSFPLIASHSPEIYLDNYSVSDFSARILKRNGDTIELTMHSTGRYKNGYDDLHNDSLLDTYVQNRDKIEHRLSAGKRLRKNDQPLYIKHISKMKKDEVISFDKATVVCPSCIARSVRIDKKFIIK